MQSFQKLAGKIVYATRLVKADQNGFVHRDFCFYCPTPNVGAVHCKLQGNVGLEPLDTASGVASCGRSVSSLPVTNYHASAWGGSLGNLELLLICC